LVVYVVELPIHHAHAPRVPLRCGSRAPTDLL